jgi:hypothetical protein
MGRNQKESAATLLPDGVRVVEMYMGEPRRFMPLYVAGPGKPKTWIQGDCFGAGIMAVLHKCRSMLWLDAHADSHTPDTTKSGHPGGMARHLVPAWCDIYYDGQTRVDEREYVIGRPWWGEPVDHVHIDVDVLEEARPFVDYPDGLMSWAMLDKILKRAQYETISISAWAIPEGGWILERLCPYLR